MDDWPFAAPPPAPAEDPVAAAAAAVDAATWRAARDAERHVLQGGGEQLTIAQRIAREHPDK